MAQSQDQNYIRTTTMTDETDSSKFIEVVQYFDGLGRPVQTVPVGITPEHNSLATLQEYDGYGRDFATWLPAVITGKNGTFTEVVGLKSLSIASNLNDSKPYAKTIYEASPLNRVLEQYGPGSSWHNWNCSVKTKYLTNEVNGYLSCICFTITGSDLNTSLAKSTPFAAGELYVTQIQDEVGNTSYEFKNKQGQVILIRQLDDSVVHDTYYVYDDFGNLSYVIPPMLADKIINENKSTTDNSLEVKQYAYLYKYDERNRCIRKRLPGCDWIYYVYDKGDRLIFTQNAKQRKKGEWLYSVSDALGRVVQTGLCYNTDISNNNYKDKIVVGTYTAENRYSFSNFSPVGMPLVMNYYDNYDFLLNMDKERSDILKYEKRQGYGERYNATSYSAKGLLTGTIVRTAHEEWVGAFDIYCALYYDNRGRLIQSKKDQMLGGVINNEYIAYNFQGQPVKKLHEFYISADNSLIKEVYSYQYDHAGRLMKTKHQLNEGNEIVIAQNAYNELGQLVSTQVNNQSALKTSYAYNIRSRLIDVDHSIYKEKLGYDKLGNITSINDCRVSRNGLSEWEASIKYDAFSRIIDYSSISSEYGMPSAQFQYDKHGNLKTIIRNSSEVDDILSITHLGNQMQTVVDSSEDSQEYDSYDFKDITGLGKSASYEYDLNGSIIKDPYKGVTISNNIFNLPQEITVNNPLMSGSCSSVFLATGEKFMNNSSISLRHSLNPSEIAGGTSTTASIDRSELIFYFGNIICEVTEKEEFVNKILIDNGYIKDGNYYFYVKDHLGNNRATASATGQIVAADDYYPFGMPIKDCNWEENPQTHRFGGKEFETLMRLNIYDFHARLYDPALARFMSIDPLCEKYYSISPYVYCNNNPIRYIDPSGRDWYEDELGSIIWNESNTPSVLIDGQVYNNIGENYSHTIDGTTYDYTQNDLTSITYTGITGDDWVSQMLEKKNCYKASMMMLEKVGVATAGRSSEVVIVDQGENGRVKAGNDSFNTGILVINDALESGDPIIVGVDYRSGSPNADGMTDHFVVVSSMKQNINNGNVAATTYNFFDPGTRHSNYGTSINNTLSVSRNQITGVYVGKPAEPYTVVTIRRNQ